MKNTWKLESFTAEQINENIDKKVFTIPMYQRGVVWSQSQKDILIDTIKKGLPFGSLLLYYNNDDGRGTYQIIDGLQRSTTIIDFVQNPAQYFNEDDIVESGIEAIFNLANLCTDKEEVKSQIKQYLFEWVKNEHSNLSDVKGMQFVKFGVKLSKIYPSLSGKEVDIGDLIETYKAVLARMENK